MLFYLNGNNMTKRQLKYFNELIKARNKYESQKKRTVGELMEEVFPTLGFWQWQYEMAYNLYFTNEILEHTLSTL